MTSSSSKVERQDQSRTPVNKSLPDNYGDTKIVLLPRDPYWSFAYWEINAGVKADLIKKHGTDTRMGLRVYDVTGIEFTGSNANQYFDIFLNPYANNWYINLSEINRSWCVDLGFILSDGTFVLITRSNIVHMPRYGVSPIIDEKWAIHQKDFESLIEASGVDKIGKSSFGIQKAMMEHWQEIVSVSSGQLPSSPTRKGVSVPAEAKPKDFWLEAQAELIVYGRTVSTANLTINNKTIELNADGSFMIKFFFTDGTRQIPIKAVSQDKSMSKSIDFTVSKSTMGGL